MQERESNNTLYAFTSILSVNKIIQRIYLYSKYSIFKNISVPDTTYDNNHVILLIDPVKMHC